MSSCWSLLFSRPVATSPKSLDPSSFTSACTPRVHPPPACQAKPYPSSALIGTPNGKHPKNTIVSSCWNLDADLKVWAPAPSILQALGSPFLPRANLSRVWLGCLCLSVSLRCDHPRAQELLFHLMSSFSRLWQSFETLKNILHTNQPTLATVIQ